MEAALTCDGGICQGNGDMGESDAVKIPDRLLKREQERQDEAVRRREAKEKLSVTEEKIDYFSSAFNAEKTSVEEMLSSCSAEDRGGATQVLEEVTLKIQQLQKFLNDSTVFLTQYELRHAQEALQKLQSVLAEKRDEVIPKKKFAFRSRTAGANKKVTPDPVRAEPASGAQNAGNGGVTAVDGVIGAEQFGFSSVDSQVLTKGADEIQQRDVLLTHLTNCKVRLHGSPSTLHIKHVRDCEILCGPVSSSVFVDQCSGCTLAFPCQQLRTHNTTNTQVYLHVTSRAIIEDCSGVGFAPFTWSYPGMDADFKVSGLDRDRNNWSQVDDFNWLAAGTPSPNWTVIPEPERKITWD
ncbi:tubulin-specific chaperone C-like [Megalops cyprinoides]|uniref:tubulin-specific chaperone C-like n=1 Tax=Megalops cyprinoides TaxID=118141 RepID=UPI0018655A82|nr:tubulin-specific chaperone C-like [Megalops cyprinoides]